MPTLLFARRRRGAIAPLILAIAMLSAACDSTPPQPQERLARHSAPPADTAPRIDGVGDEPAWNAATWYPLDQRWLGDPYEPADFQGRFKLLWTPDSLYLLAEIVDDTLIDIQPDPAVFYWDDDCLEIFVDADHSGGDHQYSHNAFAYHIALDGAVMDMTPERVPGRYDHHLRSSRTARGDTSVWEVALAVFDDSYRDDADSNRPITLEAGQRIGFALAYCDNDSSEVRENFIGSVPVPGEDKNRGWIDAGIFGTLILDH